MQRFSREAPREWVPDFSLRDDPGMGDWRLICAVNPAGAEAELYSPHRFRMEGSPIQLFNGAGAMRLSVVSAAES